jgi:hypothetical protein
LGLASLVLHSAWLFNSRTPPGERCSFAFDNPG